MLRFLLVAGLMSAAPLWSKAVDRGGVARLKTLAVKVSVDPAAGLDAAQMQAGVEARLRAAGIRIDPKARDSFQVVIAVSVLLAGRGAALGYAYSVHVSLNQQVYLARNPNVLTQAATWESMSMRTSPLDGLRAACQEDIARRVEEFVSVYRSVNPAL